MTSQKTSDYEIAVYIATYIIHRGKHICWKIVTTNTNFFLIDVFDAALQNADVTNYSNEARKIKIKTTSLLLFIIIIYYKII